MRRGVFLEATPQERKGQGTGGWVAEDDCSNCEMATLPCGLCGAGFAVDKRLGGGESWGRKAGGREHGMGRAGEKAGEAGSMMGES